MAKHIFHVCGAKKRKARLAKSVRTKRTAQTAVYSLSSIESTHCRVLWCGGSGILASKWCGLWTSEQPTCMWSGAGPAASAAGGVVTWCLITLAPEERSERHWSAHVEASGCCWLEHDEVSSQFVTGSEYRLTSVRATSSASVVSCVDGLCVTVTVARSCHCRHMVVESQTSIMHDYQYFHIVSCRQIDACDGHGGYGRWDDVACSCWVFPIARTYDLSGLSCRQYCR